MVSWRASIQCSNRNLRHIFILVWSCCTSSKKLEITIGVDTFQLSAGDSIYFDSLQKHTYRSLVKKRCTAIVITTASAT